MVKTATPKNSDSSVADAKKTDATPVSWGSFYKDHWIGRSISGSGDSAEEESKNGPVNEVQKKIGELKVLLNYRATVMISLLATVTGILVSGMTPWYAEWTVKYMESAEKTLPQLDLKNVLGGAVATFTIAAGLCSMMARRAKRPPAKKEAVPTHFGANEQKEAVQSMDKVIDLLRFRSGALTFLLIFLIVALIVAMSPQYGQWMMDRLGKEVCDKATFGASSGGEEGWKKPMESLAHMAQKILPKKVVSEVASVAGE